MSQFNECPVSILEGHLQYPTYLVFHLNITHVKLRQLVFENFHVKKHQKKKRLLSRPLNFEAPKIGFQV